MLSVKFKAFFFVVMTGFGAQSFALEIDKFSHTVYAGQKSYTINIKNDKSLKPVAYKATVFSRSYTEDGEEVLKETNLVRIFPKTVVIGYNKTKGVRINVEKVVPEPVEKSFRIYFKELKERNKDKSGVEFETDYSPVFYVKDKKEDEGSLLYQRVVKDGKVFLKITNNTNSHIYFNPSKDFAFRNILAKSSVFIPNDQDLKKISAFVCYGCDEVKTYDIK